MLNYECHQTYTPHARKETIDPNAVIIMCIQQISILFKSISHAAMAAQRSHLYYFSNVQENEVKNHG